MSDQGKKWYVLRAIGGKEKKVQEYLEKEVRNLGYTDYVSKVLIPTEKVYQIRNGKRVSKDRILFPGYVFIEANLVGELAHILSNIPNVIGFLNDNTKGGSGAPIPLRQAEVSRMLGTVDESALKEEELSDPFVVGESVKVIDGPFSSFTGVIEEVMEDKKKLKVSVKIFGRKSALELGFFQVEKEN